MLQITLLASMIFTIAHGQNVTPSYFEDYNTTLNEFDGEPGAENGLPPGNLPGGEDETLPFKDVVVGNETTSLNVNYTESYESILPLYGEGKESEALSGIEDLVGKKKEEPDSKAISPDETTTKAPICEQAIPCIDNTDCPGGICIGLAVGKCNCGACLSFVRCENDEACGGLRGACVNGYCDCEIGFRSNGLISTKNALETFCNIAECNRDPQLSNCYGLPCNPGVCLCPH